MRLASNSSQCERVLWVICHFRLLRRPDIYSIIGDAPFLSSTKKRTVSEWKRDL